MKSFGGTEFTDKLHGWSLNAPIDEWGAGLIENAHKMGEIELVELFDYMLTRIKLNERN